MNNKLNIKIAKEIDLDEILNFQESIINNMQNKEWFTPLTKEEFLTPIKGKDNVYLLIYNNKTIGLLVTTCNIPEVLAEYKLPQGNYMLIDSIMIKEEYRGKKLQRELLKFAYKRAKKLKMDGLVATIHPDNLYSLNNFLSEEYKILHKLNIHGGPRNIVIKKC